MKTGVAFTSFALLAITTILYFMNIQKQVDDKKFIFASNSMPYSGDPMEYDSYIHHYAFTSIFGTLVTAGKKGTIAPQIAESWSHEDNSRHWIFKIKNNLFYSNGEKITAEDYAKCLKRFAYLIKTANSQTGLVEYLEDFQKIDNLEDIKSIYSNGSELHLKFAQSMPEAPFRLAFGFYALVHPSLYDGKTGKWVDSKKTISSNAYEVKVWNDESFVITLRENLEGIDYSKAIQEIQFIHLNSITNSKDLQRVDFAIADKDSLMFDDKFEYRGTNEGFNLGYVECYGWNDKNNPLSNKELREWLRFKFYEGLNTNGMEITTSFFPPSLLGVNNTAREYLRSKPDFKKFLLVTHTMNKASKITENQNKKSVQEIMDIALRNLGNDSGVDVKQIEYNESMEIEKVLHLAINGTGIESENFHDTLRFMFNSKHGANLPDLNGKIKKELERSQPDINFINQEIWDQSILWPVRYYSKGHWFKKESTFNFEIINLKIPAIDFQFILRK